MFWLDLFFPKFCLGCGRPGCYLCLSCQKKLKYFDCGRCLYCNEKSLYGLTHPVCQEKSPVDGFLTIFHYNDLLKKIIKAFKYRRAIAVWQDLCLSIDPAYLTQFADWKKNILSGNGKKTVIQAIPLHPKRLTDRGFNQAELITDYFNRYLRLKRGNMLWRQKETKPQAQINKKKERRKNISHAFAVKKGWCLKKYDIVLVDDLLTTGDTCQEAAKTLKKAGAEKIYVLTLAKG